MKLKPMDRAAAGIVSTIIVAIMLWLGSSTQQNQTQQMKIATQMESLTKTVDVGLATFAKGLDEVRTDIKNTASSVYKASDAQADRAAMMKLVGDVAVQESKTNEQVMQLVERVAKLEAKVNSR